MDCYLYEGERLVFEGDGWGIIVDDGRDGRLYAEGSVYGTHQECTESWLGKDKEAKKAKEDSEGYYSYGENCWEPEIQGAPTVCRICNEAVPAGVQALIQMEAWTRR